MLLFVALSTKENAVWAPLAAAVSIMLRPKPDESLRRRIFIAAAMFLPIVLWLGLRFAFFGGIGGTYVTARYTSPADFLSLTFYKLKYVDTLFISPNVIFTEGRGALLDRVIKIGTRLLIYVLFCLWALRILPETVKRLRNFGHGKCWPTMDPTFLVALWAATALAFHFALPAWEERYATSVAMFAWPALVAEADRRRKAIIWLGLAVCCVVSLTRSSYHSIETLHSYYSTQNALRSMSDALRQVPPVTRRVYVVLANRQLSANPEYLRVFLGVTAEIVIVTDIYWACGEANDFAAFDHSTVDGVVNINVTLPACASFDFWPSPLVGTALANGRLFRNDTISYDLPEAYPISPKRAGESPFYLGRKMTVHVRPNGPARFIILRGGRKGNPAWVFDTP
jgi:hypothetical protein